MEEKKEKPKMEVVEHCYTKKFEGELKTKIEVKITQPEGTGSFWSELIDRAIAMVFPQSTGDGPEFEPQAQPLRECRKCSKMLLPGDGIYTCKECLDKEKQS